MRTVWGSDCGKGSHVLAPVAHNTAGTFQRDVLYVEDDADAAFLFKELFAGAGVTKQFHVATDGQMAVDYLAGNGPFAHRDQYPLPCLVLLDLKLPRKHGLEVLAWIRQQPELKKLVVIIFTSWGMPDDINRAYELGANGYLVKPVSFEGNEALVKLISEFWLHHNQFAEVKN